MKRGLFALLLWLAFAGGSYLPYHLILPVRITHQIIITGVLAVWLWRRGLPNHVLTWPLVCMAGAALLSVFGAIDSRVALENFWHWLTNILLTLAIVDWYKTASKTLWKSEFVVFWVIAAISALEYATNGQNRVSGAFGVINLTGGYVAALAVPLWARAGRWRWPLAAAVAFVLFANMSRGALLAAGVSVLAYNLLVGRRWPVAAGLLVAGLIAAISSQPGRITGDALRLDMYGAAERMALDHPLTGVGVGMFGRAYTMGYHTFDFRHVTNMLGAHNLYLNMAAEMGGVGLAAGAGVGAAFLWAQIGQRRNRRQRAALAALIGVAAHMMVDNFAGANYAVLVALLVADTTITSPRLQIPRRAFRLAGLSALFLLLMFVPFLARWNQAQWFYEDYLRTKNPAALETASAVDPALSLYQRPISGSADAIAYRPAGGMAALTGWGRYAP